MNYFGRLIVFAALELLLLAALYDHGLRLEMWQVSVAGGVVGLLPLVTGLKIPDRTSSEPK